MVSTPIKKLAALGAFALFAAGCSGGGGLDGATPSTGTTSPTANIFGLVTANSLGLYSVPGKVTASDFRKPGKFTITGIEGCAVKAYDVMSGSQVGASATTDANGKYTIDGLDAGEAYKIVADCGNNGKFASVETSDMSAPADKSPVVTDPLSSLVAAKVIQSIYDAVGSALDSMTGVSDSVKATIKRTLLETVVPSLTAQIKSAITEAVKTGAMEVPSASEATSLTTAVASTSEASKTALETATTSYETDKSIPPSVTKTFEGAKSDAGAMVACSSTYGGTSATCTKALAKLMFNGLGFDIIIKSGGVFGTFTCEDTDTVLAAEFQNFTTAKSVKGNQLPEDICLISSKIKRLNRNARAEDNDDKGGPLFSETFNMDGQAGDELGYISALGNAMFNNYSYRLSDIDKLIFGFDAQTKAGLNSRLMQMRFGNDGPPKLAYLSGTTWTPSTHAALANGPWPLFQCMEADAQGVYSAKDENFNFWVNNGDCPTDSAGENGNCTMACNTFNDIITAVSANNFTTAKIFEKSFGGPIPTASKLEDQFDNGRTHMDNNPSGQAYMMVLWDAFPMWEKRTCVNAQSQSCQEGSQGCVCTSTRPCDTNSPDFNPNECKASDGGNGSEHTVRVNLTFGTTITDANAKFKGFKPITAMTKAANGRYYLSPIWDMNGFSGLFNIIDGQTGTYLRDDYGNFRSIKVIVKPNTVNATKECSTNHHGAMTDCAQGKIYNAAMQWESGGVSYYIPAPTAITYAGDLSVNGNVKVQWQQCQQGQPCSPGKVAYGDWSNMTALRFAAPTISNNAVSVLSANSAGAYYLTPHMNCNQNGCTQDAYYLMNESGVPYGYGQGETLCDGNAQPAGCVTGLWHCDFSNPQNPSCDQRVAHKLTVSALSTLLGSDDLDGDAQNSTTITWDDNVVNYQIPNAPAANPVFRCSGQPWFIDGNSNGVLDCNEDDTDETTASGDMSFAYSGDAQRYMRENNVTEPLIANQNGYAFGDPVGAKTLVTTAFKGWLDGQHSLTSTTNLTALQTLALVFLYMEEGGGGSGGRNICTHNSAGTRVCLDSANPNAQYKTITPMFEGGGQGNPLVDMNKAFGAALTTFKQ